MILVTGATGHIGNVLIRELLKRGQRVRALVRPGAVPLALSGLDVEIVTGDILDTGSLERAFQDVSLVYHLAARISLKNGFDPETELINLEGTRNVLAAIRQSHNVHRPQNIRLVFASSVYALRRPADGTPIDEAQPFEVVQFQGIYDQTKARASLLVQEEAASGLDAVIVCPTAVTGPFDFHDSDAGRAIRLYMRPGIKFNVKGAYDFVDVRDVAHGFIQAAEKGRSGETYILGGERMTVQEMANMIAEASGSWHVDFEVPLWLAYWIAGLMPLFHAVTGTKPLFSRYSLDAVCSNSLISHAKASRELGFQPRPVRQAILDAIRWFQQEEGCQVPCPDLKTGTAD